MQKDYGAVFFEVLHCGVAVYGTPAGGNNVIVDEETEKCLFLYRSQGKIAAPVYNVLQGSPFQSLDQDVGIDKGFPE